MEFQGQVLNIVQLLMEEMLHQLIVQTETTIL